MLVHFRLRLSTARAYPFGMFVSIDRQREEKKIEKEKILQKEAELGIDATCCIMLSML